MSREGASLPRFVALLWWLVLGVLAGLIIGTLLALVMGTWWTLLSETPQASGWVVDRAGD